MAKTKGARRGRSGLTAAQRRRVVAHIRALVRAHGSQESAAKAIGISQAAVSFLLSGENDPSLGTVRAIARARGIDWPAMLSGEA